MSPGHFLKFNLHNFESPQVENKNNLIKVTGKHVSILYLTEKNAMSCLQSRSQKKKSNQPEVHVYFIELSPVSSIGHRIH